MRLTGHLPHEVRVLDVGAGPGTAALALATTAFCRDKKRAFRFAAVEPSPWFQGMLATFDGSLSERDVQVTQRIQATAGEIAGLRGHSTSANALTGPANWLIICNGLVPLSLEAAALGISLGGMLAALCQRAAAGSSRLVVTIVESGCTKYHPVLSEAWPVMRAELEQRWQVGEANGLSTIRTEDAQAPHLVGCQMFVTRSLPKRFDRARATYVSVDLTRRLAA